jgi:hypothetical protein
VRRRHVAQRGFGDVHGLFETDQLIDFVGVKE